MTISIKLGENCRCCCCCCNSCNSCGCNFCCRCCERDFVRLKLVVTQFALVGVVMDLLIFEEGVVIKFSSRVSVLSFFGVEAEEP